MPRTDCATCKHQLKCGDMFAQPGYCPRNSGGHSWLHFTPQRHAIPELAACAECGIMGTHNIHCSHADPRLNVGVGIDRPQLPVLDIAAAKRDNLFIEVPMGVNSLYR